MTVLCTLSYTPQVTQCMTIPLVMVSTYYGCILWLAIRLQCCTQILSVWASLASIDNMHQDAHKPSCLGAFVASLKHKATQKSHTDATTQQAF